MYLWHLSLQIGYLWFLTEHLVYTSAYLFKIGYLGPGFAIACVRCCASGYFHTIISAA